jgi:hypothetical protein
MKRVFFLMLTLMVLSAASMNAQVRIGGSIDPNPAAVLDLNADNTATPATVAGGFSLPRVSLDTTNVKLKGQTPLNGTMVYNTNASMKGGQGAGVYIWTGKWNSLVTSIPVTSITLAPAGTVYIPVGSTVQVTATTVPANATNSILSWSSSNTTAATVNANGLISGKVVGTSTVTAKANDGSGRSATVAVNVFAEGSGTTVMSGSTYPTYTFPNGAGTWMTIESTIGTADTIMNGTRFYSAQNAPSACSDGWSLGDSIVGGKLADVLRSNPELQKLMSRGTTYTHYSGDFYVPTGMNRYVGSYTRWWLKMTGPLPVTRPANVFTASSIGGAIANETNSSLGNHRFTVKCYRP